MKPQSSARGRMVGSKAPSVSWAIARACFNTGLSSAETGIPWLALARSLSSRWMLSSRSMARISAKAALMAGCASSGSAYIVTETNVPRSGCSRVTGSAAVDLLLRQPTGSHQSRTHHNAPRVTNAFNSTRNATAREGGTTDIRDSIVVI